MQQDRGVDEVMHKRLQAALSEAKDSKREAYEELFKRQKVEKNFNNSMQKVRCSITKEAFMSQLYELHLTNILGFQAADWTVINFFYLYAL